ncbi:MAG: hypothetical protein ACR2KV_06910 [Solirubrobacteraceae bacterium]
MTPGRLLAALAVVAVSSLVLVAPGRRRPARPTAPPIVAVGRPPPAKVLRPGPGETSRAFLAAYVAFAYGRLNASRLPEASPAVLRRAALLRAGPAPAAVLAAADPRLRTLRVSPRGAAAARAVAVIADGASTYAIALDLRLGPRGWTITGITETG